jgi:hypothetical protein
VTPPFRFDKWDNAHQIVIFNDAIQTSFVGAHQPNLDCSDLDPLPCGIDNYLDFVQESGTTHAGHGTLHSLHWRFVRSGQRLHHLFLGSFPLHHCDSSCLVCLSSVLLLLRVGAAAYGMRQRQKNKEIVISAVAYEIPALHQFKDNVHDLASMYARSSYFVHYILRNKLYISNNSTT